MSTIFTGLMIVCGVLAFFGVLAAITAVFERLPSFPPMYTEDDILPPPNVRSQRQDWDQHEWWQS